MGWRARLIVLLAALVALASPSVAQARVSPHFFGVIHNAYWPVPASDLDNMDQGGVGGVRWGVYWSAVEPIPGTFRWSIPHAVVGALASKGIPVLPVISGSPAYAALNATTPPVDSPAAQQHWTEFLRAMVGRYGPNGKYWTDVYPQQYPGASPQPIRAWQIWNEPNLPKYFTSLSPIDDYAKLVRISHDAIGAVDPGARIILGGMPGLVPDKVPSWRFLDRLYSKRVKPYFDAVALHPYAHDLDGQALQLRKNRRVMKANHDGATPIWITEMGWGSGPLQPFGINKGVTGQKRWLVKSFNLFLDHRRAWNLQRVFWFEFRDVSPRANYDCSFCPYSGLFTYDFQPKPSWRAFQRFTGALP